MRSRSWSELLPIVLGAILEGIWSGALAALFSGVSGPALMAFATAVALAAALLAQRAARGEGPSPWDRAIAVGLVFAGAGTLLVTGRAWVDSRVLLSAASAVVFAALLVFVGISLGRAPLEPESAVGRAVRSFGFLCAILAATGIIGSTPVWAAGAIISTLVVGALLVAVVRYETLSTQVPRGERAPALPWLVSVVGVLLLVVLAGALVSLILRVDVIMWVLAAIGGLLRYLVQALGYGIASVGGALLRALSWLLSLFHVHALYQPPKLSPPHAPKLLAHPLTTQTGTSTVARHAATLIGVTLAIGASAALVAFALRRFRPGPQDAVVEERESVVSLREAAVGAAARLVRRLRRMATRLPAPQTPAELVRRRYAELERRLGRAGRPRAAGTTVRAYLASVASIGPDGAHETAADLATVYELARYSDRGVNADAARRFESRAAVFGASTLAADE